LLFSGLAHRRGWLLIPARSFIAPVPAVASCSSSSYEVYKDLSVVASSDLAPYFRSTADAESSAQSQYEIAICVCARCSNLELNYETTVQVDSTEKPFATLNELADYLTTGFWPWLYDRALPSFVRYNLSDSGTNPLKGELKFNLGGFDNSQFNWKDEDGLIAPRQGLAREALKLLSQTLGINFQETFSNEAQFLFADNDRGAYASTPLFLSEDEVSVISTKVNIDKSFDRESNAYGDYIWSTFLHEIGHGLGLGHSGPYNGDGTFEGDAIFANDSWQLSMMSYIAQSQNPNVDASVAFPATPMVADWIALDRLYGEFGYGINNAFKGDTIYGYNTNIDAGDSLVWSQFVDIAINGASQLYSYGSSVGAAFTIVDGGGYNTLDLSGFDGGDQRIDLRPSDPNKTFAYASDILGWRGNLTIAPNTFIHVAKGGLGNDIFIGNEMDNTFWGTQGSNIFWDSLGNNVYHGGDGLDSIYMPYDISQYSFRPGNDSIAIMCFEHGFTKTVFNSVDKFYFGASTLENYQNYSIALSYEAVSLLPQVSITAIGGADSTVSSQGGDNMVVGTAEASLAVSIFSDNNLLGTTTANSSGAFSYALSAKNISAIGEGSNKAITARQTDQAGNTGSSQPFSFAVDTIAPLVTITGIGGVDSIISSQSGDNTVLGTAEASREVSIFFGTTQLGTTTANGLGGFSYELSAANLTTIGQGSNKAITARQTDGAGNTGSSAAFSFAVDTTAPVTTAVITAVNDNVGLIQGVVASGARTDDRTPTITGTISAALAAGESLRIFNGSTLLGSATVNNSALTWSYTTASLPSTGGTSYSISARVADAAGNLGTASAVRTFVLDTTAPVTTAVITAVNDNVGLIQGVVASGARTDDRTPTITGTISAALAAGESLRIFNGSTLLGSATVNNSALTWSYTTASLPSTGGTSYSISARVADAAGNLGTASAVRTFVLDTTAPVTTAVITAVNDNVGLIQGVVASGARTDDRTPTITGTISAALAAGESLRIFNGSTLLGSATVNNSALTWSYTTASLPSTGGTSYSISARVADAAGNLGTASAVRTFVLDTTAPVTTAVITAVNDNVGLIQGVVASGARTDDRTPTITGTISAALAAGESLRIFNGSTLLGSATVNNSALTWSYTTASLPSTGGTSYSISARVADAAGNLGTASAVRTFVLDTTAPVTTAVITAVNDNVGLIQGVVASGARTDDRTPTITGTISAALAAGESLRIFNGSTLLGSATVNNSALTWSYTTASLPSTGGTSYSISARVADAAGNLGTASAVRGFTLDTVAPSPQIDRIGRSVSSGFRVTAARKARTIRGSGADANADVQIFQGRRPLLTTRADGDGVFSHTFSSTEIERIGQGRKSFFARQEDAAGNRGDSEVVRAVVNTTRGTAQRDELTGVGDQRDVFRWNRLDHSLLRRYDTITNFEADDRIRIGSTRYRATVKNSSGVVNRLNAKQINKALDRRQFAADSVAAFRQRGVSGTFLVINDDRAGFQAGSDAVIRLAGFNVNHSSASIAVV
jgi:protein involved in ribonucleotide reduction